MTPGAGHPAFPTITPGPVHRWGGAALVVARRPALHRPPPLSAAEQRVLEALPVRRHAEWTQGRLLAKRLVGDVLAVPPAEVEVLPRDDGSPHLVVGGAPTPSWHVSVSHTTGHAAAALAPQPVGVDLCETASAAAVHRAADHVLSPAERTLVGTDRPEAAAAAWALKEAAVKADRSSLFGPAPRRIALLALHPPLLTGRRHTMLWHTDNTVLALVLAPPPPSDTCSGRRPEAPPQDPPAGRGP
ncbi:4'-phosphopantetheinyl transferase family protein [Streptomyces sp. NRRL F-2664]|uniref:4'-phosphopantetheinyl transferase family protein n=1 Tax=Streptomyces sp. NRRL F-2664 TaxID=1463842 RepID=UPI00068DDBCB|nr:4'-phosphopantetheinyl transferase superfamily protein [Streptomyces sp. NRRL F-2664]